MSETAPLAEVAEVIMGQSPPGESCNRLGVGVPLLNGPTEFGSSSPVPVQWTEEPVRFAEEGDVLFCVRGSTTGRTNIADQRYCIGRGLAAIRGRTRAETILIHHAIKYRLDALLQVATGSTFPSLSREDLASLEIPWPTQTARWGIAGILGALDDKIESNRRLCGVVDGLVRAELENLADLPSSEENAVGELAERIHKPADPQKLPPSTNYIGLEHMPRGLMILDEWGIAEGLDSGKSSFEEGDVLFGKLRPNFRKVGVSPVSGICSTDILVLRPKSGVSTSLLLAVVSSEQVLGPAIAASSGTKMPRISWDYIAELRVQIPDEIGRQEFSDRIDPMIQRVLKAVRETQVLTETRDALLPGLLSGRLRVSDAEKVVEGAV